jgi:TRAP transporter TAXI family solute receptor
MKVFGRSVLGLAFAAAVGTFLLPDGSSSAADVQLTIQGFQQGTSIHTRAETFGEVIRKFVGYPVTVKTGTGLSSAIDSAAGKLDLFISLRPYQLSVEMLQANMPALAQKYREGLIIPTEEKAQHLIVLDEVKASSFSEIVSKKVPVKIGLGGAGATLLAEKIFAAYGITSQDIASWGGKVDKTSVPTTISSNLKDGLLNAYFVYGGGGSAHLQDLGAVRRVRMLPIAHTDAELKTVRQHIPECYRSFFTSKDFSFIKQDVPTIAFSEFLVSRPDLPEEVVYNITKAIWSNGNYIFTLCPGMAQLLVPQKAMEILSTRRNDIHPGAVKYYKEKGWLK